MRKIIWSCWFQGRNQAPGVVRKCLESWESRNPAWEVRVLDAESVSRYVDIRAHLDLTRQTVVASSLADLLRILLLHEYGGVWVDATAFCNVPLDDWLPEAAYTGFFAFDGPGEGRPLSNWFLAAEPGNPLMGKWVARAVRYWRGRERTLEYFWVQQQFGLLCSVDKEAFRAWHRVPRVDTFGPLEEFAYEDFDVAKTKFDWTIPVFKLVHRFDPDRLTANCLIGRLLGVSGTEAISVPPGTREPRAKARAIRLPEVRTQNLWDHLQTIAGESMLRRAGLSPSLDAGREERITHEPAAPGEPPQGILLNGEIEEDASGWPPHPACDALYLGFQIGLLQASSRTSTAALAHYASHGPVGCGDRHTLSLLRSLGVDAFLSHCLTLTFPRRLPDADSQKDVFVVSRDDRILRYLPQSIGPFTFISHEADSSDPAENRRRATELLETYRDKAKLVITTMADSALPVISMGIPVVVFYPPNDGSIDASDRARFSSIAELVRVFRPEEAARVDWEGYTPDVSALKLKLIDRFFAMAARWGELPHAPVGPIAPLSQMPAWYDTQRYLGDAERLAELKRTKAPDRQRWGAASSYPPAWTERARVAAEFICDGSRVLEIGTGTGSLRELIEHRCQYTGSDLEPIDRRTLVFDVDHDPMPCGSWDAVVLLGVLECLYRPAEALRKISSAASKLVISCRLDDRREPDRGNSMTEENITEELAAVGFRMSGRRLLRPAEDQEDVVFEFSKALPAAADLTSGIPVSEWNSRIKRE